MSTTETCLDSNVMTHNATTLDPPLLNENREVAIPYLVLIMFAFVVGFFGNTLIIGAFIVSKRVRIVGNEYALNLAIADLTITVCVDPFLILGVTVGEVWFSDRPAICEFVAFLCLTACITAFLSLTAVTINRYIYVCHGHLYDAIYSRARNIILCILCWALGALFEMVNFDFISWGDHRFDRKHKSCMWDRTAVSYTLFLTIFLIGLPITVMVIAYILIFIRIKKVKRLVGSNEGSFPEGNQTGSPTVPCSSTDSNCQTPGQGTNWLEVVKSTRTFFLILVAFIITWGPYAIVNAVDVYDVLPMELHLYVSAIAHMHAAANCVIYGATNPHFRSAYRRVLGIKPQAIGNGNLERAGSPTMFATQGNFELDVYTVPTSDLMRQNKTEQPDPIGSSFADQYGPSKTHQSRYAMSEGAVQTRSNPFTEPSLLK